MPPSEGFSERPSPQDTRAEQSVLGAMLTDNQTIPQIQALLRPEDFYADKNRDIYQAIITIAGQHKPVDLITLPAYLQTQPSGDSDVFHEIGGLDYLTTLININPSLVHAEDHARIVEQKATLRRLQHVARTVIDEAFTTDDAGALIAQAEAGLQQITMKRTGAEKLKGFEGIGEWIHEYATTPDDDLLPTGLDDLDEVLEIRRGEVHGIMGPPKMGKSTLARQAALNQARDGMHVLFISLEESKKAQYLNFLALEAGVDKELLRRKVIRPGVDDWHLVVEAAKVLDSLPIKFDFAPAQNMGMITAKIRFYTLTWGVDMVYVDTGQAVSKVREKNQRSDEPFIDMIRDCEAVAKRCDCAVIVVVQAKQDILDADSYWLTPNSMSDAKGMIQAFYSVIGVMRPEKIKSPKSSIFYGHQKLFAIDKRWKSIMALFTVAYRNGQDNVITPVYCNMETGAIANLHEDYWPWRAPEDQLVTPQSWVARKKRTPRAAATPAAEEEELF